MKCPLSHSRGWTCNGYDPFSVKVYVTVAAACLQMICLGFVPISGNFQRQHRTLACGAYNQNASNVVDDGF
jgi:hypothetical protein